MRKPLKKILIACNSSKSLFDVTGKLVEKMVESYEVYVFLPKITQQHILDKLSALKITIYEADLDGGSVAFFSDVRYCWHLYKALKKVNPDVFFPSTVKPVIYGTLIAKKLRIKRITPMLSGLGYSFSKACDANWLSKVIRFLFKASLKDCEQLKIIMQNNDDHRTLLRSRILSSKQPVAVVNGPGVDIDHYTYCAPEQDTVSFMMSARLINAKGVFEYFEAARIVKQRYPEVQFMLIGSYGPNIDTISLALFNQIKNGNIVNYQGNVDDVRPHIKKSSVVVLPSYYGEGIPRCLLEGMAMGRAIITCESVGCRETVENGANINGKLVPIKNVSALVAAMEFYLNHKNAILEHGINGYKLARKKFDINLVNSQMLRVMQLP